MRRGGAAFPGERWLCFGHVDITVDGPSLCKVGNMFKILFDVKQDVVVCSSLSITTRVLASVD